MPPADLLEGYLSDSSVEADGDDDPEVTGASATKPTHRTCAAAAKVSSSRAEAIKTTKAEAEKKRKRGKGVASSSSKPADKATASSGSEDEVDAPRSPSQETKRKKVEALKVTEADLLCYKESLIAKSGVQRKVSVRPPPRPLNPHLRKTSQ